jgi:hypothetical protein
MGHSDGGVNLLAFPSHQAQCQRSDGYSRPQGCSLIRTAIQQHNNLVLKQTSAQSNNSQRGDSVKQVDSEMPEKPLCAMEDAEVPFAGEEFIAGLGLTLEGWVAMGDRQPPVLSSFHCVRAPPMGVKDYLKRIHSYFQCSDECYVIALVIIDRVGKVDASLTLCRLNVPRLLVSAVMLAAKFHDDVYYSNAYYAKVGGLGLKEMNQLEAKLMKFLNWKVNVAPEEYREYHRIVCEATRPQSTARSPLLKKEPEPEP